MTTPKVAKMPATLQELMKMSLSADDLMQYSLEELEHLHSLSKQGQTKPAKLLADMLDGRIKSKRKELAKEAKKPEPVANSTKPADAKPASGKAGTTAKPAKPASKPAGAAKSATASKTKAGEAKGKATAAKPATKPATKPASKPAPAARRGSAKPEQEESAEQFPPTFAAGDYKYDRINVTSVEELGEALFSNPYQVFMFVDEKQDDGQLTQFIVVYTSHECTMLIDKSRKFETFMQIEQKEVERNALIMTEGKQEYTFPFAVYVRTPIK